jgi:predicted metal-dependent HD superfamily phosphohydrolase
MADAAVAVKRKQDQLALKEFIKNDPTDIFHHLIRASELVETIRAKVNNKDVDLGKYWF